MTRPASPLMLAVADLCAGKATVMETVERLAALRPFKVCTCCQKAYAEAEWLRLEWCGHQHGATLAEPCLEMRHCVCGSTLAVEVAHPKPDLLTERTERRPDLPHEKYNTDLPDPEETP